MKNKFLSLIFLTLISSAFAQNNGQVLFKFKYKKGDLYRILSTVNEAVYINGNFSHNSKIINRVTAEVTDVAPDGTGTHDCNFMTSEEFMTNFGSANSYGEEYKSIFSRSPNGTYSIEDTYFMPTVRDVPLFPDKPVSVNEKWTAKGHEAHDMRRGFGIQKPFKVPFDAEYKYIGVDQKTGLHLITVDYTMKMTSPRPSSLVEDYPAYTEGYSAEKIYWDNEKGCIHHYTEDFEIKIQTAKGSVYIFKGTAGAEITEFAQTATEENLVEVQKKIEEMGIKDVEVKASDKGLTLAIENIQFHPNSAFLLDSEKAKLQKIKRILEQWPNNDILVTGHTAKSGSEESCQTLSEQRAVSVANYLVQLKCRDKEKIFTQGKGSTQPVAPNTNERNMSRNRRVEITILDK